MRLSFSKAPASKPVNGVGLKSTSGDVDAFHAIMEESVSRRADRSTDAGLRSVCDGDCGGVVVQLLVAAALLLLSRM